MDRSGSTTLLPITVPKQKVFVLWDYENIGRVMGSLKFLLIAIDNLRSMALKYGEIKSFTCFFRPGEGDAETKQALQDMGLVIHEVVTQRKESVDVRILTELIQICVRERNPFTLFLLSSDRDFSRAVSMLSSRGHHTIVVYKNGSTSEIAKQVANESIEWASLLPKLDETQKRLLQQALTSLFHKTHKLSRAALDSNLDKIKHSFGYANTWSFIKFLQDWDMLKYDSRSKTYSLPYEVRKGDFVPPSIQVDQHDAIGTAPTAADIQLYITLFETIISKIKKDTLVPRELFVIGHFEDILQNGDLVYGQLFKEYTGEEAYKRFITTLIMGQHCNVDSNTTPRILWPKSGPYTAIDPYEPTERLYNSQMSQLMEFAAEDHLWRSIDNMFDLGQYLIEKGPKFFREMTLGYVLEQAQLLIHRKKHGLIKFDASKAKKTVSDSQGFIFKQGESYKSPASQILKLLSKASSKPYILSTLTVESGNNNNNISTTESVDNEAKRKNESSDSSPSKKQKTWTQEELKQVQEMKKQKKQQKEEKKKMKDLQKMLEKKNKQKEKKEKQQGKGDSEIDKALSIPDNPAALFEVPLRPRSKNLQLHLEELKTTGYQVRSYYWKLLETIASYFHLNYDIKIEHESDTNVRGIGTVASIKVQTQDMAWNPNIKAWLQNKEVENYTAMLLVNKLQPKIYQTGFETSSTKPQGQLNLLKYQLWSICKQRSLGPLKLGGFRQPDGQWKVLVSIGSNVDTFCGSEPIQVAIKALQQIVRQHTAEMHSIPLIDLNAVDDEPESTTSVHTNFNSETIDLSD